MAFAANSKTRKIVDYLAEGRTLTAAQAQSRFGQVSHYVCWFLWGLWLNRLNSLFMYGFQMLWKGPLQFQH